MDRVLYEVTRKTFYFWRCHAKLRLLYRVTTAMQNMGQEFSTLSTVGWFRFWTASVELVLIVDFGSEL